MNGNESEAESDPQNIHTLLGSYFPGYNQKKNSIYLKIKSKSVERVGKDLEEFFKSLFEIINENEGYEDLAKSVADISVQGKPSDNNDSNYCLVLITLGSGSLSKEFNDAFSEICLLTKDIEPKVSLDLKINSSLEELLSTVLFI